MEDLIPFIIVIAISIIGAATRKKQRPPVQGNHDEEERVRDVPQDDLLGWMERLMDEQKLPFTEKHHDAVPVETMEESYEEKAPVFAAAPVKSLYHEYSGFISPEERDQMMKTEAPRVFEKSKTTQGAPEYVKPVMKDFADDLTKQSIKDGEIGKPKLNIDFDLKKAIIYSTILERKYI
jgi:hypothetical protein